MLVEEIESLRGQMQDLTAREEALLAGLADSMHQAEQRLLGHVREIAARHGERRIQLIDELRALASGMGTSAPSALATDADGAQEILAPSHPQVTYDSVVAMPISTPMSGGGGSWRDATRMIADDEGEIERLLRVNAR